MEWIWKISGVKSPWEWMERSGSGHGGGARLVEEEEEKNRGEPFPPTTYIKAGVFGLIFGPSGNPTKKFRSKSGSGPE
jgi:hypothetical protein